MKTNLKLTLPILALAATTFSACSDEDSIESWIKNGDPDPSKELISFTSNGGEAITRASLAGTRAGFTAETKIVMRIKANDGTNVRYTKTSATAGTQTTTDDNHNATGLLVNNDTHSHVTFDANGYRYWDDAFGRDSKLSIYAIAVPQKTSLSDNLLKGIKSGNDDTFNKGTKISDNNPNWFTETTTNEDENTTIEWSVQAGNGKDQNSTTIAAEDLCYSNNIRSASESEKGVYRWSYSNSSWVQSLTNGQMQWNQGGANSTTGKFDEGHLIFKHALCKITINLTEGVGFDHSITTDFAFDNSKNVALLGFPTNGTFNIAEAKWANYTDGDYNIIEKINLDVTNHSDQGNNKTNTVHSLTALVLPNRVMYEKTDNAISFTIDGNKYYVTCDQIATKIREYANQNDTYTSNSALKTRLKSFEKMQQGDHYVINITVGKKQIDNITAALVAWEEVGTTQIDPTNTFITFTLEDRSQSGNNSTVYDSDDSNKFSLYRAANVSKNNDNNDVIYEDNSFESYDWKTGYNTNGAATKSWDATNNRWETEWYWPNNFTYYHIRAIGDAGATSAFSTSVTADAEKGDYFSITSGNLSGTTSYKDYIWGAPFKNVATMGESGVTDSYKFVYTPENGFDKYTESQGKRTDSQIFKAIGPTKSNISMVLFHMTSQIFVNVTTTTDADRVVLGDETNNGTKVELLHFYTGGTVLMGTGKVAATKTLGLQTSQEIASVEYTKAVTAGTLVAGESKFSYGVVPQDLSGTDNSTPYTVGLCITTKDGNKYYVNDLSKILANTVSNKNLANPYSNSQDPGHTDEYVINKWYPGYQYTYTIKLTKKGIDAITASLVDWETVTGNIGNITLED